MTTSKPENCSRTARTSVSNRPKAKSAPRHSSISVSDHAVKPANRLSHSGPLRRNSPQSPWPTNQEHEESPGYRHRRDHGKTDDLAPGKEKIRVRHEALAPAIGRADQKNRGRLELQRHFDWFSVCG